MNLNLPYKVRAAIYMLVVLGTAIIVPLYQFKEVADVVMAVWSSFAGAASLLAAFNVTPSK